MRHWKQLFGLENKNAEIRIKRNQGVSLYFIAIIGSVEEECSGYGGMEKLLKACNWES